MKLAYHYHTLINKKNNQYWIASYQGVFIDALASQVDELHLIFHLEKGRSISSDYQLKATNIKFHNLGSKTSAWKRFFRGPENKNIVNELEECAIDYYIFRAPSPLCVFFGKYFKEDNVLFYVVGDYEEGSKNYTHKGLRQLIVKHFTSYMGAKITKTYKNRKLIVNSDDLFDKLCRSTAKKMSEASINYLFVTLIHIECLFKN